MINRSHWNQGVVAVASLVVLLSYSTGFAQAEIVLKNLKKGIPVQLKTDVNGVSATHGQLFEGELPDTVRYKNWTLPAGTDFKGQISDVKHSRIFNRPGYVVLQVDEATLPNGQTMNLDPAKYEPPGRKTRHPEALTLLQAAAVQLPYTLIALAVTVPLTYGADADGLSMVAVGEAIRVGAGAVFGLVRPKFRNEPVARKLALGALDGSGIPRVVGFFGKYPEPDLHSGDQVTIYPNEQALMTLFENQGAAIEKTPGTLPGQTQPQPAY